MRDGSSFQIQRGNVGPAPVQIVHVHSGFYDTADKTDQAYAKNQKIKPVECVKREKPFIDTLGMA